MARPKLLMTSHHHWASTFQVGSQQMARAFVSAGWDVAYVASPISPLHFAKGVSAGLADRTRNYLAGGSSDLDDHLWAYVPGALATPANVPGLRSRWLHRNWQRLSVPRVEQQVARRGFGKVDLLYFDSVAQPFWLDALDHRRSVLRVADRMAEFGQFTPVMSELQRQLARSVDLVAYSAMTLAGDVTSMGARRALHMPNGVDFDRFFNGNATQPIDLAAVPRPIVIYVGAIDEWFDFRTMNTLTAALPDVSFVLVGPDRLARERLTTRSNLHLLGIRPYGSIPAYLKNSDVGLIPFDVVRRPGLVNSIHPLKLYEYLACGLPVVATAWEEISMLGSPAALCRTTEEFATAIRDAISAPHSAPERVEFARVASWQNRVESLLESLGIGDEAREPA